MTQGEYFDYVIVGAGINGLTFAYNLLNKHQCAKIIILEKESRVAFHASGHCSGNLHAGFFYTDDPFKIQITIQGNRLTKEFIREHKLPINSKPVVITAQNDHDVAFLEQLEQRAHLNGIRAKLISSQELSLLEPRLNSYRMALISYENATTKPELICQKLQEILAAKGVVFRLDEGFESVLNQNAIRTTRHRNLRFKMLINCAGLYVDKVARQFGLAVNYSVLALKGVYHKAAPQRYDLTISGYSRLKDKGLYLGTQAVIDCDNQLTLGAVTYPCWWRENYAGFERFKLSEFCDLIRLNFSLYRKDKKIREFFSNEFAKYRLRGLVKFFRPLLKIPLQSADFKAVAPGILAKLVDIRSTSIVNELCVEKNQHSFHLLNGISHGFTSAFALTAYLIDHYEL